MLKKLKTFFIRVLISILSLVFVFYSVRGELKEGLSRLTNIEALPLLIAIAINFLSLAVVTFRIERILSIQKIHLSFKRLYYLWNISLFFNLFLPSAVGGDIAKAYYIAKDSGRKMASITSVLLDRFFGLMATISIGFFTFMWARKHIDDPRIGQLLFWVTGIVLIGVLFLMSHRFSKPLRSFLLKFSPKRFHEKLHKLFEAMDLYRKRPVDFCISYAYSLLAQAMFIVLIYFLARSIHIYLPVALFFLFLPLVTVISMIPSIGGLGVREAAMVYLFRGYAPLDQAVALSLMCDLFLYGIGCLCGILYAVRGGASICELERIENE